MALLCSTIPVAAAAVQFQNFASPTGLRLARDAVIFEGKTPRLTPAQPNSSGAAWLTEKQRLGFGFDSTFQFQLTRQGWFGGGADGFAFVLQNTGPAALGGRGSAGVASPWQIRTFIQTKLVSPGQSPFFRHLSK